MCVNQRWITNRYTGSRHLVKCGRCKACLQEKAVKGANRIRREYDGEKICLFVTLTYDRISCPYVLESDLLQHKMELPIYRDVRINRSARTGKFKRRYGEHEVGKVIVKPEDSGYFVGRYKWLKHRPHKVGVCFYKDFQDFIKRLRINCSRSLISHHGFSVFACNEIGPVTKRPHFHFTMFVRPSDEAFYRSAILQAWPFAHQYRTAKYIKLGTDPAGYVASYVNCRNTISSFFAKYFKPKHSFSKYFGTSDKQFSLSSILSKVTRGDLTYTVTKYRDGERQNVNFLIPFYVINRFFPKFKGYSRLTCDEISYHLFTAGRFLYLHDYERPHKLQRYCQKIDYSSGNFKVDYQLHGQDFKPCISHFIPNDSDLHKINVRLVNAYNYYHDITGRNRIDYAIDFQRVWTCYRSNVLKMFWERKDMALFERFDNLSDVWIGNVCNDDLLEYLYNNDVPLDPNEFPYNKSSTVNMSGWFDKYDKERKVTNQVMSDDGHYV